MILEIGQYVFDLTKVVYIDHFTLDSYCLYFTNRRAIIIAEKEYPYSVFIQKFKNLKNKNIKAGVK